MLTIRMQRTGRKGHAMFRVVVQDSRQAPTSGKVVAPLGSYDPHTKTLILNKEKAVFYLQHGAQPSDRAARLLKNEGVKLPGWVKPPAKKKRTVKNAEKRRSTAPAKPVEENTAEAPAEEATATEAAEETTPTEDAASTTDVEAPAETPEAESPADESAAETETAENLESEEAADNKKAEEA
jgi:small subunit ribosomal protein S16